MLAAELRNPESELLQADVTWIVMHMLHAKGSKDAVWSARLSSLPMDVDSMYTWSDEDLKALKGSRWQQEAVRRRDQLSADFRTLALEFGPDVIAKLGLQERDYCWARQVVEKFGMSFVGKNGSAITLLAPGMELFESDDAPQQGIAGAQLEFDKGPNPVLVLYATKDYTIGERPRLYHRGLACDNGRLLMSHGVLMESNPWDCVEICMTFGYNEDVRPTLKGLVQDLSNEPTQMQPGDCLPADMVEGWMPVRLLKEGGDSKVQVNIRITKDTPLPSKDIMCVLGIALVSDPKLFSEIVEEEKQVVDVFGERQCERRSLVFLQREMKKAVAEYADKSADDGSQSRIALASRLVTGERDLLLSALDALEARLKLTELHEAPKAAPLSVTEQAMLVADPYYDTEPGPDSTFGRALAQLRGCVQSLRRVSKRFAELRSGGQVDVDAGNALLEELRVVRSCLANSGLGDPADVMCVTPESSEDTVVRTHVEATKELLLATVASLDWKTAGLKDNKQLADSLVESALARMRLLDFANAHADLQRCLKVMPDHREALQRELECVATLASRSPHVLGVDSKGKPVTVGEGKGSASPWAQCGPVLTKLRDQLKAAGYMTAGTRWAWPTRKPGSRNMEVPGFIWDRSEQAAVLELSVGSLDKEKQSAEDLTALVKFFMFRKTLLLDRVVELLGPDACKLLLERRALSCYNAAERKLLEPGESVSFATKGSAQAPLMTVFANVALWPVEEDLLVAVDFDQAFSTEGGLQPVMHLADDSRALIAGAPQHTAKKVLDVNCGSGVQGLVALKHYAEHVTFVDPNSRALRFAQFSAHLNGLEARSSFVQGDLGGERILSALEGPFNAILAHLPLLPNPNNVITGGGPLYSKTIDGGEKLLASVVGQGAKLLAPGGWLVAAANIRNAVALPSQMREWMGGVNCQAAVFLGKPRRTEIFQVIATDGCSSLQKYRYAAGLQSGGVHTMSQAVLLLWARAAGMKQIERERNIEVRDEGSRLWGDQEHLQVEVRGTLDSWLASVKLNEMLSKAQGKESMYAMSWDDEESEDPPKHPPMVFDVQDPQATRWRLARSRNAKAAQNFVVSSGFTWQSFDSFKALGFAPPGLIENHWWRTFVPEPCHERPGTNRLSQRIALVEFGGASFPTEIKSALRDSLEFKGSDGVVHLAFDGQPRQLRPASGAKGVKVEWADLDTVIVIIPPNAFKDEPSWTASMEALYLVQAMADEVRTNNRWMRLMIITCGCHGPGYPTGHQNRIPPASTTRGVGRATRQEVQQIQVCLVDSDALGIPGRGKELAVQVSCELECSTPDKDLKHASQEELSIAIGAFNREVAYRNGERFTVKLDLSPGMPILPDRQCKRFPETICEGVILITGGTGGLGVVSAEAFAEAGARKIVLTSRSGRVMRDEQGLQQRLDALDKCGCEIHVFACDSSDRESVKDCLQKIRTDIGPLRGIVHSAGVLADNILDLLDVESFKTSFKPKCDGAWILHEETIKAKDQIEAFVMFSSVAALFGNTGQLNYAAANTFLDELARLRQTMGLPGIAVQWPAVAGVGMWEAMDAKLKRGITEENFANATVHAGHVKSVMKVLFCDAEKLGTIQSVLPLLNLIPMAPMQWQWYEPILRRSNPSLPSLVNEFKAPEAPTNFFAR